MFFYLLFVIFLLICYLYFQRTEEDKYQKRIHENIHADAPIIKFVFNESAHYQDTKRYIQSADFFEKHSKRLHDCGCQFTLDRDEILNGKSSLFDVNFDDEKRRMYMKFDHSRLGGSCFLKLKAYAFQDTPIPIPRTNLLALSYAPRLCRDAYMFFNSPFTPLPRHEHNAPVRYSTKETLVVPSGITKRVYVNHRILKRLYACIAPDRPLRILIPVPFERFNVVNNNIGAMLLLYHGEDLETFAQDFEAKKYMAGITNALLVSKLNKAVPSGGNIREKIDIILTSFYSNMEKDIELYWTTQIKPTEAMYIGAYSRVIENTIFLTTVMTSSTTQFKPDEDMMSYECTG